MTPQALAAVGAAGGLDLGKLLVSVQEARAAGGQDRQAVAKALRVSLGAQGVGVIDASGGAAESPRGGAHWQPRAARRPARRGPLTPGEFAAQKAALPAET